jgi:4-amino-4-deoxy-L-arabinose transferase-like glycosyltransferase
MYVTVPFVFLFGLNEWGVRLPSVFFGTLSVFFFYFLVKKFFRKEIIALLSAFFLATSPWHIHYSRAAFELSLLLFLFLIGMYLVLLSFEKKFFLPIGLVFLGLTLYTYSTANLLFPLLFGLLVFTFREEFLKIDKKIIFISFLILFLISIPIGKHIIFGHAAERFSQFSVFGHREYVEEINLERTAGGNILIERIFHNKPLTWIRVISLNYLSAFSPLFLLERGDVTFRHSVHEMGEIFWAQFLLLFFGVFYLLTKGEKKMRNFWLGWLLLAPIPASLTWDGAFHASRLFLMIPPLMVIFSLGAVYLYKSVHSNIKRMFVFIFLSFWFMVGFIFYLHRYFIHYPIESWRWWHKGYKEAMLYLKENEKNYKMIVMNNSYEPVLIRFLFWQRYDPAKFHREFSSDKPKSDILPGFDGFQLSDRYYFGVLNKKISLIDFLRPGMIYMVSYQDEVGGNWDWEKNPPKGVKVLKTVRNPYGEPIFYLISL